MLLACFVKLGYIGSVNTCWDIEDVKKLYQEINDFALKRNLGNNLDLDFLKRAFKKTYD